MSIKYDKYLTQHIGNVEKGFNWICENLPDLVTAFGSITDLRRQICGHHDNSKYSDEEYYAYDKHFYGNPASPDMEFRYAWLHHIHNNPHHWQYWILHNDDPDKDMEILDMPYNYILEMICDWWSFSWKTGKLDEIFEWYDAHKAYMKLSDNTRKTVEDILEKIKSKLDEPEEEDDGEESDE